MRTLATLLLAVLALHWLPWPVPPVRAAQVAPPRAQAIAWDCIQSRFPTATVHRVSRSELRALRARFRAAGLHVRELPTVPLSAFRGRDDCAPILLATNTGAASEAPAGAVGEASPRGDPAPGSEAGGEDEVPATPSESAGAPDPADGASRGSAPSQPEGDEAGESAEDDRTQQQPRAAPDLEPVGRMSVDFMRGCDDACAPVLFVVLGAVLIWFVVAAAVDIGAQLVLEGQAPPIVVGMELNVGYVSEPDESRDENNSDDGDGPIPAVPDEAVLAGIRGFVAGRSRDNVEVGLAAEYGRLQGRFGLETAGESQKVSGDYWMAGPMAVFGASGDSASRVFLDLLVGRSDDPAIDNLAMARVGGRLGLGASPAYVGAGVGAVYLGLDDSAGVRRDEGNFNWLYSLVAGVQF